MTEEQRVERIPEPVEVPETGEYEVVPEVEPEEGEGVEDLSDLAEVTKEDVLGKRDGNSDPGDMSEIASLSDEDMVDLFEVSNEDLFGEETEEPKPKARPVQRVKRTTKRYLPPPTSVGGIRG